MTIAVEQNGLCEEFLSSGRRYRWHEGDGVVHPRAERLRGRRRELPGVFATTIVPGLVKRQARRQVLGGGARGGSSRACWVTWLAPGDRQLVWALYVPTRLLAARALADLGRPANDGMMLAAWGDGPVLAWASDRPELRDVLREALRTPPAFLSEGMTSADVTLPLRIVAA